MQRLLAFIENNLHLILFLLLQTLSLILLLRLNPYQRAVFSNSATEVTARVNNASSSVANFIGLRKGNEELMQLFKDSLSKEDPRLNMRIFGDSIELKDSVNKLLFSVVPAQVVYHSIHKAENVMVINQGKNQGVKRGSGVISASGVAGIVVGVGPNFSTVMSMQNIDFHLIPQINGQEFFTELQWENEQPNTLSINKINKLEQIKEGDLVSTGTSSLIFPPDIPIGTIEHLQSQENSQYFNTKIRTATDFRNLRYVFVLNNEYKEEIEELLEDE